MRPCSIPECMNPVVAWNLCDTHYRRLRRSGTVERDGSTTVVNNRRVPQIHACEVCGIEHKVHVSSIERGGGRFCSRKCDAASRRTTGRRILRYDGYMAVKIGVKKYQLEHRYVMEQHLGRKLTDGEHVHHQNGDRADNRIDNLAVMPAEDHRALHKALRDRD